MLMCAFQSTYLYKVRRKTSLGAKRTNIRFNPRTYIRYDVRDQVSDIWALSFNPRTYIRYDVVVPRLEWLFYVSIHVPI